MDEETKETEEGTVARAMDNVPIPLPFSAAPIRPSLQVEFFQSVALPEKAVATINRREVDRDVVRSLAGWRLDYPTPVSNPSDELSFVCALAEDILLRGTTPLCFPELEALVPVPDIEQYSREELTDVLRLISLEPSARHEPTAFESAEEEELAHSLLAMIDSEHLGWTLQSQVQLAGLAHDLPEEALSRCDLLATRVGSAPVVIEVDGLQHQGHSETDEVRDAALQRAGVRVVRVPASEVRASSGPRVEALREILRENSTSGPEDDGSSSALRWHRALHQFQIVLLKAVRGGHLRMGEDEVWSVFVGGRKVPKKLDLIRRRFEPAANALISLLLRFGQLWGVEFGRPTVAIEQRDEDRGQAGILIWYGLERHSEASPFHISDVSLPGVVRRPPTGAPPRRSASAAPKHVAEWFLNYLFRKESFWEGQWECVRRSLAGQDSLVLLPTGRGKSIAYQLSALLRPGRAIVVDPILSLMDDQIDNLMGVGIDRCIGISGRQDRVTKSRLLDALSSGHYLFCFSAPERFQTTPFREALRALTVHSPVAAVIIDEAHCVSEWGHDFRTAYLNLGRIAREYCSSAGQIPPLVGLTGTASRIVLKDVQRALDIMNPDAVITPTSFDRPELTFDVQACPSNEKTARLKGVLESIPMRFNVSQEHFFRETGSSSNAGLIFCPHVNGDFGTVQTAGAIQERLQTTTECYSGKAPRRWDDDAWEEYKIRVARRFKRDDFGVLVCTKAFGMGIDKPNIRYAWHTGLPPSVEAFYQEAGRAGRDRQQAFCGIVLSVDHPERARRLLDPNTPVSEVARIIEKTGWDADDDITRALFFHVRSFRGIDQELSDLRAVMDALAPLDQPRKTTFSWESGPWGTGDEAKRRSEKALYRLVILGVVRDYSIAWSQSEFTVDLDSFDRDTVSDALGRYGRAYQAKRGELLEGAARRNPTAEPEDFLLAAARLLLEFTYETIELARRRALDEMYQAARAALEAPDTDQVLRGRILNYLTQTDWDRRIEDLPSDEDKKMTQLGIILDDVVTRNDAVELRAAAARQLASYPDQPSALLLRAAGEVFTEKPSLDTLAEDVRAAVDFGREKYGIAPEWLAKGIASISIHADRMAAPGRDVVRAALSASTVDRAFCRSLVQELPARHAPPVANHLLSMIVERTAAFASTI